MGEAFICRRGGSIPSESKVNGYSLLRADDTITINMTGSGILVAVGKHDYLGIYTNPVGSVATRVNITESPSVMSWGTAVAYRYYTDAKSSTIKLKSALHPENTFELVVSDISNVKFYYDYSGTDDTGAIFLIKDD